MKSQIVSNTKEKTNQTSKQKTMANEKNMGKIPVSLPAHDIPTCKTIFHSFQQRNIYSVPSLH